MDIGLAFSYPFKDADWLKKLALIGVVGIIPIIGYFVVIGYLGQIIQRHINNDPELLPNLDFSKQLGLGFKIFVVVLVFMIPVFIIQLPAQVLGPIFGSMSASGDGSQNHMLLTIITVLSLCCSGLAILYEIVIAFFLPIAFVKVAITESIAAGFKFGEIFAILKSNFVNYLIIVLVTGIASSIILLVGFLVCVVGLILAYPYTMAMQGSLYAQAFKIAQSKAPAQ